MKKLLSLTLTLILTLSLSACGSKPSTTADNSTAESSKVNNSSVESQPQTVVVPNVVGMDKDEAVKTLEDLGLKVEVEWGHWLDRSGKKLNYDNLLSENEVYSIDPKANILIATHSTVSILVNTNCNPYDYEVNTDQSITLTKNIIGHVVNKEIVIPEIYEGMIVSGVTAECLNDLYHKTVEGQIATIIVPKTVKIIGDINSSVYKLR